MAAYRRAKVALEAFRNRFYPSCKITPKPSTLQAKSPPFFSPYSFSVSRRLGLVLGLQNVGSRVIHRNPFLLCGGDRRFYYVDRQSVRHFRQRGWWFQNPRMVFIVVVVSGGVIVTVYFGHLETVPYTNRKHFVLLSKNLERKIGEAQFQQIKESFKGKMLPAIHPESIRVRLIAKDIIDALKRGLRNEEAWTDLGYASPSPLPSPSPEGGVETDGSRETTLKALSESQEGSVSWYKDDEVLDDNWIQKTRNKGLESGAKADTLHLDAFKWEVLVVDEPVVNAFCLPGGKIVVFTGLLKHFRADDDIATVLGHEVGHAVARHVAEGITKNFWVAILQLILYQFIMPDIANVMSTLFLRLPFSRKMEIEADYIGVLLMASAGYDPRVAPKMYEKLGKLTGDSTLRDYLSTHPSGKKRAQLLARAKVMEEAFAIYRESIAGRGIEGFL